MTDKEKKLGEYLKESELTRQRIDEEQECTFRMFLKYPEDYPDTYKEERPDKSVNIHDYYYDQSVYNGIGCVSAYLPMGISRMDTWMTNQILRGSKYTKDELETMIRRNPHLHNIIKTNLLHNLNNLYGN